MDIARFCLQWALFSDIIHAGTVKFSDLDIPKLFIACIETPPNVLY